MAVAQPGPVTLTATALQTVENEVDSDAKFIREKFRITNEKMPVSAADLPHDGPCLRKQGSQLRAQGGATLGDGD